jgi:hypothetical protein
MSQDKYSAVWVSYSSISDFLNCPRLYYLKNIYRSPSTGNKVQLASPSLSLGYVVHEVLDYVSTIPLKDRFKEPFTVILSRFWHLVSGLKGGFTDKDLEQEYKNRAEAMLSYCFKNPGPLANLAVKIKMDLPHYYLSKKENIILCGKLDWLEYLKESESVHIIDFKTGTRVEKSDSLQLPIYYLLATNCQHRPVVQQSYWYLDQQATPQAQPIPNYDQIEKMVLEIALKIKTARKLSAFKCSSGGCSYCRPYEQIFKGQAEFVTTNSRNIDIYLPSSSKILEDQSEIL